MLKNLALATCLLCPSLALAAPFHLFSPDVKPGNPIAEKFVYNGFGCKGENMSPALEWKNAPKDTKSFALTVYDPDAPTGSGWWHWVVVNIPATVAALPLGAGSADGHTLPAGTVQVRTDFGAAGWGGPCPPAGDKPHHYIFTLHALKTDKIELPPDATAALAGFMIHANEIGKAQFTARYGR